MLSVYVIVTNEFIPTILRGPRFGDTHIKSYEKLGHARSALTQMRNDGRKDAENAIIVKLSVWAGTVISGR